MPQEYVADYLEHLRANVGLCAATVSHYRSAIQEYTEYLAALSIPSYCEAPRDTIAIYYRIIIEKRKFADSTVRHKAYAVYAFYEWLRSKGIILLNPCPKPPSFKQQRLPRRIPRRASILKMYRKLYETNGRLGPRDYSIIDIAYSCGLRRCEIAQLNVDDVCIEEGTVRVRGKAGHERVVPIGKKTLGDLQYYIYRIRPQFLKDSTTKALFVTARKGGKRMCRITINQVFWRLRQRCGISRTLTPHALRHAFATDLLRSGAPLQDVSRMLGHVSFETTQIYTRVVSSDLKRIHHAYHPRG